MNFDRDERLISAALEALDSEIACPELMKGIDEKLKIIQKTRRVLRRVITAAVIAALLGATAYAASIGGLDWLLEKAEVPFADVVDEAYESVVSNGIRISIVAKQNYGDMSVIYVTLEDTEGLGRVDGSTWFSYDTGGMVQSSESKLIYFDEETGIAAFQLRLGAAESFAGQTLKFKINRISYGRQELGEIKMDIDLAEAVKNGENIGEPYEDRTRGLSEQLTVGHVADIRGSDDAWVSAIGVLHGYLTVQRGLSVEPGVRMVSGVPQPYLRDPDGNIVEARFGYGFMGSSDVKGFETMPEGRYFFIQEYFDVDAEKLEGFTLCFKGHTQQTIAGEWEFEIDFDNVAEIIEVTVDINVKGVQMNSVRLSLHPFGMILVGDGVAGDDYAAPIMVDVVIETTGGDVALQSFAASRPDPEKEFECVWHSRSTIDMDNVTAIRIGDNRIVID